MHWHVFVRFAQVIALHKKACGHPASAFLDIASAIPAAIVSVPWIVMLSFAEVVMLTRDSLKLSIGLHFLEPPEDCQIPNLRVTTASLGRLSGLTGPHNQPLFNSSCVAECVASSSSRSPGLFTPLVMCSQDEKCVSRGSGRSSGIPAIALLLGFHLRVLLRLTCP